MAQGANPRHPQVGKVNDGTMTDGTGKDRIRMTVAEARAICEVAMLGTGHDADDARILTNHLLDAALCGYEYSSARRNC